LKARIRTRRAGNQCKDSGYMLLFLMIAVAVLTIMMLGVARNYRRGLIRDREVEMMHRGDQYSRAIKRYYKKNGTYPISIEQLEKANNIRYLRKRYKDPMSPDGAWKLVHLTDITLKAGGGLAPAAGAGAQTAFGAVGASAIGGASSSAFGSASSSAIGQANSASGTPDTGAATGATTAGTTTAGTTDAATNSGATTLTTTSTTAGGTGTSNNAATGGQVLGGGPFLGVVSKMKAEGIHSFGDKTKYNEWFFIYDPTQDRGQLLVGPYNPNMFLGASSGTGLNPTNSGSPTTGTGTATAPGFSLSNQPSPPMPSMPAPSAPTQ
jgi:type II secretory pathway pseudopilin PulG